MFWQNDGLHFRQPWVMGVQQEIERLELKFLEQEKLLRECEAFKVSFLLNVETNFYKRKSIHNGSTHCGTLRNLKIIFFFVK